MKPLSFYRYKRKPLDHQRREFEATKNAEYWGYAHDMGTGKTKIIFDRAQYLYRQNKIKGLLIIAPKGVHEDHITIEAEKDFFDDLPYVKAFYSASPRKAERQAIDKLFSSKIEGLRIFALNTDAVRTKKSLTLIEKFLNAFPSFVAVDESSGFAGDGTLRTKGLMKLSALAKYRAWMDGTPINQGALDLYYPCEFLKPGLLGFPTFASFKARYAVLANGQLQRDLDILICQTRAKYKRKFGDENWESFLTHDDLKLHQDEMFVAKQIYNANLQSKEWDYTRLFEFLPNRLNSVAGAVLTLLKRTPLFVVGFKNLDELKNRIRPFTSRVELQDVRDMPDLTEQNIYYDLSGANRQIYEKLKKDYLVEFQERGEIMSVSNVMTLYGRLQQLLGGFYKSDDDRDWKRLSGRNQRIDFLFSQLNKIDHQYKVLIFARYVEEIKEIARVLGLTYGKESVVTYYGGNTDEEQREAKRLLRESPFCRYMVINPTSGALGLNLISANYIFNFSRVFSHRLNEQLVRRMYRGGQKLNCFKINIIARDTIDDQVIDPALKSKKDVADFIVNDINKFI